MAKLNVKTDCCLGCGMCLSQNEEYFEWTEEGLSKAKKEQIEEKDVDALKEISEMCPVNAIEVIEEENTEE